MVHHEQFKVTLNVLGSLKSAKIYYVTVQGTFDFRNE